MANKKYLRKREFRYYINPKYLSKGGNPHPAFITARYKHKYKFNVITHSRKFFSKDTVKLDKNPNLLSKDRRPSRISVPMWDSDVHFDKTTLPKWFWRFSKKDKLKIKKINKKNTPGRA